MKHKFVKIASIATFALTLSTAVAPVLAAQKPQIRRGFWISLGGGFGSVNSDCTGCNVRDLTGTDQTGYLRLGGTLNRHLLVGVEFGDWKSSEAGVEQSRNLNLFSAYYYPLASRGLFLKGGLGGSEFADGNGVEGRGWAVSSGIGYDLRIFRNISVTTEGSYWFGNVGRLKNAQDVTVATNYRQSVFDVRLGLTIH